MKYRLLSLLAGIVILGMLVQCKNSISEADTKPNLERLSLIAPEFRAITFTLIKMEEKRRNFIFSNSIIER